jgi:prophage regulatory protein
MGLYCIEWVIISHLGDSKSSHYLRRYTRDTDVPSTASGGLRRYNFMRSSPDQPSTSSETELLTGTELSEKYPPTRILRLKEVTATIGLGRAAIYQMQREGKFPKPVKIGVRAVGWIAEDVLAWMARRANRKIATTARFPEEHGEPRQRPKSEARPVECQVHRNDRRCISQHEYQELQRLRAVEQRVRQMAQLQNEIVALLATPASAAETQQATAICVIHGVCEETSVTKPVSLATRRSSDDVAPS